MKASSTPQTISRPFKVTKGMRHQLCSAFFKELVFVTQGATLNEALARCRVDNIIILYIYVSRKKRGSR